MSKLRDPRVDLVVKVMERVRVERMKRMMEVRDMRRNDGRVRMADEAREIIAALDKFDADAFDAAIAAGRLALEDKP